MSPPKLQANGVMSLEDTPAEFVKLVERNAIASSLLQLPAEIRNRIARLACSSETRIVWFFLHHKRALVSASRERFLAVNPLQNVCKLWRAETRWLELKINKVHINSAVFRALHTYGDPRLEEIKGSLDIFGAREESYTLELPLQRAILSYARANAEVEIAVKIANWSFTIAGATLQRFVCFGWSIEAAMRSEKRIFIGCKKTLSDWCGGKPRKDVDLDLHNLRFYPKMGTFEEDVFRRLINEGDEPVFVKKKIMGHYKDEDKAVDALKLWFDRGL